MKKRKVMSISIAPAPEMESQARKLAKAKGLSTSAWIRELIRKALEKEVEESIQEAQNPNFDYDN